MPSGAVAIFVKTPGLSPVKTRLAQTIGRQAAEEFYCLSAAAVQAVVRRAAEDGRIVPYWAVAEQEGVDHPLWERFDRIAQGSGGLGERLSRVYDELLRRHALVLLIGADAPQITAETLRSAADRLTDRSSEPFVLGRARDGGFYLFGGSEPIPSELWRRISYSESGTADELAARLRPLGEVWELPVLCDADDAGDLEQVLAELQNLPEPLPEQLAVVRWIGLLRRS